MKKFLCAVATILSVVVPSWGGEEGLWGGKWDGTWPVFLRIEPGTKPDTYQVQYIWLEKVTDQDFKRQQTAARKVGGYLDAGMLVFKLEDGTGTLYGAFGSPKMANLVKINSDLPDAPDSNRTLKQNGWKPDAVSPFEAYKKITGEYPSDMPSVEETSNKATDKDHMLQIWKAIMEFKKANAKLPDYLSDLVPEFLADQAVLVSPTVPSRVPAKADPRLKVSYSYEFRADPMGGGNRTFREAKEHQMKKFGETVPILRCFAHDTVMNVAYSGDYFESYLSWEESAAADELAKKLKAGQ